jgi:hypothetical protein
VRFQVFLRTKWVFLGIKWVFFSIKNHKKAQKSAKFHKNTLQLPVVKYNFVKGVKERPSPKSCEFNYKNGFFLWANG